MSGRATTATATGTALPLRARFLEAIAEVDAAAWDACAGDDQPFVAHGFLNALEASGSCRPESGWLPRHLLIEDQASGQVIAAMPLYLKSHSYGEYVFDHAWADAWERAGGRYYPKLQAAVPFTPVTGPRLLVAPGQDREMLQRSLVATAIGLADSLELSSLHVTFPTEPEWRLMGEAGLLQRTGVQFFWDNHGYRDFDDFLAALASRKRKQIRKERAQALSAGIDIETLTGADIRPAHWRAFFAFYMDTGSRKWGQPYLNREFFDLLGQAMADRIALVMCRRDGRYIAGALNLIGRDALYGRYWGCLEQHPALHFEACYYRAIDFAIARSLKRVEAGAQGPHKLQRGYLPRATYSAHWIRDQGLRAAISDFLKRERRAVAREIAAIAHEASPYRHDPAQEP